VRQEDFVRNEGIEKTDESIRRRTASDSQLAGACCYGNVPGIVKHTPPQQQQQASQQT
jgi:hypothetical protein